VRSSLEEPAGRLGSMSDQEHAMAEITTDHKKIKDWAHKHKGKPAAVDRTHKGDDVGIIRIMFPKSKHAERDNLVEISWDEFFKEFDGRKLALIYDPHSMFSKLVGRDSAEAGEHGRQHATAN
jgi:hypothetical protein